MDNSLKCVILDGKAVAAQGEHDLSAHVVALKARNGARTPYSPPFWSVTIPLRPPMCG
jgi:hypothetical protein